MNILLLGGSGFIGGRVAALLRKHGHNVTTAHHHELNLLNLAENQAKVFLNQKDVVVNCVGVMHKDPSLRARSIGAMGGRVWSATLGAAFGVGGV